MDNWGMFEDLKFLQGRLSNGLVISGMYRPPSSSITGFLNEFRSLNLLSSGKQVMGGDFNLDLVSPNLAVEDSCAMVSLFIAQYGKIYASCFPFLNAKPAFVKS
ncbi:hypothetical protein CHUAL_010247 [Chamberlinius hualienensis]